MGTDDRLKLFLLDFGELEIRAMIASNQNLRFIALELNKERVEEKLESLVKKIELPRIPIEDTPVPTEPIHMRCKFPGCKKERNADGYCSPNHRQLHFNQKKRR